LMLINEYTVVYGEEVRTHFTFLLFNNYCSLKKTVGVRKK
jgi:hypothetical protein